MTLGGSNSDDPRALVERYVRPLIPFKDARGYLVDRALVSCGRFFGLGKRRMRGFVGRVERFGRGSIYSTGRTLADIVPSTDYVEPEGFVYFARCEDFPHIVKVGWTSQPDRRVIGLCREAGTVVAIEKLRPGTLADETLDMLARRQDHVTVEWFVDRTKPFEGLPPFMRDIEPSQELWRIALEVVQRRVRAGDMLMSGHSMLYYFAIRRAEREAA